jgi:hypothetical protein
MTSYSLNNDTLTNYNNTKDTVETYDLKDDQLFNQELDDIYASIDNVLSTNSTPRENVIIKTIQIKENITMNNILNHNILLFPFLKMGDNPMADDDDTNRIKYNVLQSEIMKELNKTENPFKMKQQMNTRMQQIHNKVIVYKTEYLKEQQLKKQKNNFMNVVATTLGSPVGIFIGVTAVSIAFNMLLMANITNPLVWANMMSAITTSSYSSIGTYIYSLPSLFKLQGIPFSKAYVSQLLSSMKESISTIPSQTESIPEVEETPIKSGLPTNIGMAILEQGINKITTSNFYFTLFLDIFQTCKLFTPSEVYTIKSNYQKMIAEFMEIKIDDTKKDQVSKTITNIFNNIEIEDKDVLSSKYYVFFKYIYNILDSKNIFNVFKQDTSNKNELITNNLYSYITFLWSFSKNPAVKFTLSSFQLASTVTGVISTTTKELNEYTDINQAIIFESLFKFGINSETYKETMKYCNIHTMEGGKRFMQYLLRSEIKTNPSTYMAFFESGINTITNINPEYFRVSINGIFQYITIQVPTNYFNTLRENASKNIPTLSEDEKINKIKKEIEDISMYKKKKYTDEQIQEILYPDKFKDPDENKYKFVMFRYMKDFKKKFKKYTNNPELLLVYSDMWSLLSSIRNNLSINTIGTVLNIFSQYSITTGFYNYDRQDTVGWFKGITEMLVNRDTWYTVLSNWLLFLYGNDDRIKHSIHVYVNKCINEIIQDIHTISYDIGKSQTFNNLASYFKEINNLWVIKMIGPVLKCAYFIMEYPLLHTGITSVIQPVLNVLDEISYTDILNNKDTFVKFHVYIDNVISSLFTGLSKLNGGAIQQVITNSFEIKNLLLKNILIFPYLSGYFGLRQYSEKYNLGGIITINDVEYVVVGLKTDTKSFTNDKYELVPLTTFLPSTIPSTTDDIGSIYYEYFKNEMNKKNEKIISPLPTAQSGPIPYTQQLTNFISRLQSPEKSVKFDVQITEQRKINAVTVESEMSSWNPIHEKEYTDKMKLIQIVVDELKAKEKMYKTNPNDSNELIFLEQLFKLYKLYTDPISTEQTELISKITDLFSLPNKNVEIQKQLTLLQNILLGVDVVDYTIPIVTLNDVESQYALDRKKIIDEYTINGKKIQDSYPTIPPGTELIDTREEKIREQYNKEQQQLYVTYLDEKKQVNKKIDDNTKDIVDEIKLLDETQITLEEQKILEQLYQQFHLQPKKLDGTLNSKLISIKDERILEYIKTHPNLFYDVDLLHLDFNIPEEMLDEKKSKLDEFGVFLFDMVQSDELKKIDDAKSKYEDSRIKLKTIPSTVEVSVDGTPIIHSKWNTVQTKITPEEYSESKLRYTQCIQKFIGLLQQYKTENPDDTYSFLLNQYSIVLSQITTILDNKEILKLSDELNISTDTLLKTFEFPYDGVLLQQLKIAHKELIDSKEKFISMSTLFTYIPSETPHNEFYIQSLTEYMSAKREYESSLEEYANKYLDKNKLMVSNTQSKLQQVFDIADTPMEPEYKAFLLGTYDTIETSLSLVEDLKYLYKNTQKSKDSVQLFIEHIKSFHMDYLSDNYDINLQSLNDDYDKKINGLEITKIKEDEELQIDKLKRQLSKDIREIEKYDDKYRLIGDIKTTELFRLMYIEIDKIEEESKTKIKSLNTPSVLQLERNEKIKALDSEHALKLKELDEKYDFLRKEFEPMTKKEQTTYEASKKYKEETYYGEQIKRIRKKSIQDIKEKREELYKLQKVLDERLNTELYDSIKDIKLVDFTPEQLIEFEDLVNSHPLTREAVRVEKQNRAILSDYKEQIKLEQTKAEEKETREYEQRKLDDKNRQKIKQLDTPEGRSMLIQSLLETVIELNRVQSVQLQDQYMREKRTKRKELELESEKLVEDIELEQSREDLKENENYQTTDIKEYLKREYTILQGTMNTKEDYIRNALLLKALAHYGEVSKESYFFVNKGDTPYFNTVKSLGKTIVKQGVKYLLPEFVFNQIYPTPPIPGSPPTPVPPSTPTSVPPPTPVLPPIPGSAPTSVPPSHTPPQTVTFALSESQLQDIQTIITTPHTSIEKSKKTLFEESASFTVVLPNSGNYAFIDVSLEQFFKFSQIVEYIFIDFPEIQSIKKYIEYFDLSVSSASILSKYESYKTAFYTTIKRQLSTIETNLKTMMKTDLISLHDINFNFFNFKNIIETKVTKVYDLSVTHLSRNDIAIAQGKDLSITINKNANDPNDVNKMVTKLIVYDEKTSSTDVNLVVNSTLKLVVGESTHVLSTHVFDHNELRIRQEEEKFMKENPENEFDPPPTRLHKYIYAKKVKNENDILLSHLISLSNDEYKICYNNEGYVSGENKISIIYSNTNVNIETLQEEKCDSSTDINYSKYKDTDKQELIKQLLFRPDIIRKLFMSKDKILIENNREPIDIDKDSIPLMNQKILYEFYSKNNEMITELHTQLFDSFTETLKDMRYRIEILPFMVDQLKNNGKMTSTVDFNYDTITRLLTQQQSLLQSMSATRYDINKVYEQIKNLSIKYGIPPDVIIDQYKTFNFGLSFSDKIYLDLMITIYTPTVLKDFSTIQDKLTPQLIELVDHYDKYGINQRDIDFIDTLEYSQIKKQIQLKTEKYKELQKSETRDQIQLVTANSEILKLTKSIQDYEQLGLEYNLCNTLYYYFPTLQENIRIIPSIGTIFYDYLIKPPNWKNNVNKLNFLKNKELENVKEICSSGNSSNIVQLYKSFYITNTQLIKNGDYEPIIVQRIQENKDEPLKYNEIFDQMEDLITEISQSLEPFELLNPPPQINVCDPALIETFTHIIELKYLYIIALGQQEKNKVMVKNTDSLKEQKVFLETEAITFLEKLSQLQLEEDKQVRPIDQSSPIPIFAPLSTTISTNVPTSSAPISNTPRMSGPALSQPPTTQTSTSTGLKSQSSIAPALQTSLDTSTQTAQEESIDQSLEQKEEQKEEQKTDFKLEFGGDDGILSFLTNLLSTQNVKPDTDTTQQEDISTLTSDEKKLDDINILCTQHAIKWYASNENVEITQSTITPKEKNFIMNFCNQNNLLGMSTRFFMTSILSISNLLGNGGSAVLVFISGILASARMIKESVFVGLLAIIGACLPIIVPNIIATNFDAELTNIKTSSDDLDLAKYMLYSIYFQISQSFKTEKSMFSFNVQDLGCTAVLSSIGCNPDPNLPKQFRSKYLSELNGDTNIKPMLYETPIENTNFMGKIHLGLPDDELSILNHQNALAEILTNDSPTFVSETEQYNQIRLSKNEIDFANYDIIHAIAVQLQHINEPIMLHYTSMKICKQPFPEKTNSSTTYFMNLFTIGYCLLTSMFTEEMINTIYVPMFIYLTDPTRPSSKNLILCYLFGSKSYQAQTYNGIKSVNINVLRDHIDKIINSHSTMSAGDKVEYYKKQFGVFAKIHKTISSMLQAFSTAFSKSIQPYTVNSPFMPTYNADTEGKEYHKHGIVTLWQEYENYFNNPIIPLTGNIDADYEKMKEILTNDLQTIPVFRDSDLSEEKKKTIITFYLTNINTIKNKYNSEYKNEEIKSYIYDEIKQYNSNTPQYLLLDSLSHKRNKNPLFPVNVHSVNLLDILYHVGEYYSMVNGKPHFFKTKENRNINIDVGPIVTKYKEYIKFNTLKSLKTQPKYKPIIEHLYSDIDVLKQELIAYNNANPVDALNIDDVLFEQMLMKQYPSILFDVLFTDSDLKKKFTDFKLELATNKDTKQVKTKFIQLMEEEWGRYFNETGYTIEFITKLIHDIEPLNLNLPVNVDEIILKYKLSSIESDKNTQISMLASLLTDTQLLELLDQNKVVTGEELYTIVETNIKSKYTDPKLQNIVTILSSYSSTLKDLLRIPEFQTKLYTYLLEQEKRSPVPLFHLPISDVIKIKNTDGTERILIDMMEELQHFDELGKNFRINTISGYENDVNTLVASIQRESDKMSTQTSRYTSFAEYFKTYVSNINQLLPDLTPLLSNIQYYNDSYWQSHTTKDAYITFLSYAETWKSYFDNYKNAININIKNIEDDYSLLNTEIKEQEKFVTNVDDTSLLDSDGFELIQLYIEMNQDKDKIEQDLSSTLSHVDKKIKTMELDSLNSKLKQIETSHDLYISTKKIQILNHIDAIIYRYEFDEDESTMNRDILTINDYIDREINILTGLNNSPDADKYSPKLRTEKRIMLNALKVEINDVNSKQEKSKAKIKSTPHEKPIDIKNCLQDTSKPYNKMITDADTAIDELTDKQTNSPVSSNSWATALELKKLKVTDWSQYGSYSYSKYKTLRTTFNMSGWTPYLASGAKNIITSTGNYLWSWIPSSNTIYSYFSSKQYLSTPDDFKEFLNTIGLAIVPTINNDDHVILPCDNKDRPTKIVLYDSESIENEYIPTHDMSVISGAIPTILYKIIPVEEGKSVTKEINCMDFILDTVSDPNVRDTYKTIIETNYINIPNKNKCVFILKQELQYYDSIFENFDVNKFVELIDLQKSGLPGIRKYVKFKFPKDLQFKHTGKKFNYDTEYSEFVASFKPSLFSKSKFSDSGGGNFVIDTTNNTVGFNFGIDNLLKSTNTKDKYI